MATTRAFTTALFKVWGVVWLVSGINAVARVTAEWIARPFAANDAAVQRYSLVSSAATTLITLGAAIVLLRFGEEISNALVRTNEQFALGMSATQLEAVLLGILGIYLITTGFREGSVIVYTLIRKASWDQSGTIEYVWRNRERELAGGAVEFIAGWLLVLGRKGIAETWARLHPMGLSDELPPSDKSAAS
jgi:hypothetical protein